MAEAASDVAPMTVRGSVRRSLSLLSQRDRWRYLIMVAIQMASSFMDLAGVLLLGLVAVMATASAQGNEFPSAITNFAGALGLGDLSQPALIGLVGGAAALLLIAKSLGTLLLLRRVYRFLADRAALVSAQLSARFFSGSLLTVQARPSQETAYALGQGTNAAVLGVLGPAMVLASEVSLLVVLGAALLLIDPLVTVGAAIYFALVVGMLQRPLSRWARQIGAVNAESDVASTTTVQEAIDCYREVCVLDRRDFYRDQYKRQRIASAGASADTQFLNLIPKNAMEVALVLGAALLAVSQFVTQDAVAAVATLVIFLAAGSRVMPSLLKVQGAIAGIHSSVAIAATSYALDTALNLQTPDTRPTPPATQIRDRIARGYPDFVPSVVVDDVSVTYPGASSPALGGVTFSLPAGASLALVGATGAGKSTLADVILGVLEPDSGAVSVGGRPPTAAMVEWAGGIAYVPQEVSLSHGTVRDNVALGLPREAVDDQLVWEALERAHLSDFLRIGREQLDTLIGERGVRLSGGQRQRLGVARALYTRPRLLVLDEATSALDAETEHAIAATLGSLEGEVTTVTVAHRLATIRHADLVVYLEGGRVEASGSFEQVRTAVPRFNHQAELLGL